MQSITYEAAGAQPIAQTTVAGNTATILINREGNKTTITFFATDNAGNREAPKTVVVNLDKTMPRTTATRTRRRTPTV